MKSRIARLWPISSVADLLPWFGRKHPLFSFHSGTIAAALTLLGVTPCIPWATAQTTYTATKLVLPSGAFSASGFAISSNGLVAGNVATLSRPQPFLYSGGAMQLLHTLSGTSFSVAQGVDSAGQVAGGAYGSSGTLAFLCSGGAVTDLGSLPGATAGGSFAWGLSNSAAVGQSNAVVGPPDAQVHTVHAFSYSGGLMTDLGTLLDFTPDSTHGISFAFAVNDAGQAVGLSTQRVGNGFVERAFLSSGGVMQDLGVFPGFINSVATAISNGGLVAGVNYYQTGYSPGTYSTDGHAFLYNSGTMFDLGTLRSGGWSEARGVNRGGTVVGVSDGVAFVYSNGLMTDLNTVTDGFRNNQTALTAATGINDSGQIVANDNSGNVYILTPVASCQPAANTGSASILNTINAGTASAGSSNAIRHETAVPLDVCPAPAIVITLLPLEATAPHSPYVIANDPNDSTPKMPIVQATAQIVGVTPDPTSMTQFLWSADLTLTKHGSDKKGIPDTTVHFDKDFVQGTTTLGSAPFTLQLTAASEDQIRSGQLTLTAKATIPNPSGPVALEGMAQAEIKGTNPPRSAVQTAIAADVSGPVFGLQPGDMIDALQRIACHESTLPGIARKGLPTGQSQFRAAADGGVGKPIITFDNGLGIFQITSSRLCEDPFTICPNVISSWPANVVAGVITFRDEKIPDSQKYPGKLRNGCGSHTGH